MTRVDALCLLSTGHLLRILIPLEEPPHLTADIILGQYDSLGLYCPNVVGLKNHCKLRKTRAALGLIVHIVTVSYTELFPADVATYSSP